MLLIMSALPRRKQTAETLLSLSPAETANLKEGINFFRNKTTGKEYIIYKEKGHLKACKNLCKHQGGLFIKDIEDLDARYTVLCSLARGPVCLSRYFKRHVQQIASSKLSSCFIGMASRLQNVMFCLDLLSLFSKNSKISLTILVMVAYF